MAREWTPDHPDGPAEPQITVVVHRSGRPPLTRRARAVALIAVVAVLIGLMTIAALPGGGSSGRPNTAAHGAGLPGSGGTFGYPFRCLSVAFAPDGSGIVRAYVEHGGLCGRYAKYVSATFRRVDGSWREIRAG